MRYSLFLGMIGLMLAVAIQGVNGASPGEGWFPFVYPWDDARPSFTDLSGRLVKPAGGEGFVTVENGRLSVGGKRVRFFGVNLCFGANFPTKKEADRVARRMAKLGIGCVRFHHMDTLPSPQGLFKADGTTIDPEILDRFDYFVAALKKQGIYIDLNLHVGRAYPGMPAWEGMPEYFKGIDQFFRPMIDQQKAFAREMLEHVNPYTGSAYKEEPAVALIEVNNENSLLDQWWKGKLDDLPNPYATTLYRRWEEWLKKNVGDLEAVRALYAPSQKGLGEEILRTAEGDDPWVLETLEGAEATLLPRRKAKAWVVEVERPGSENWHVQLHQRLSSVRRDEPLTFAFEGWSDRRRKVTVALMQAKAPWATLWSGEVELGPQIKNFQLILASNADEEDVRIGFSDLGGEKAHYAFGELSLKPGLPPATAGNGAGRLLRKRDFVGYSVAAQRAWIRFLWEEEQAYWREMAAFLKQELKVKSLIVGGQVGFSPLPMQAEFDVVDAHGYWQHPSFPKRSWDPEHWNVGNLPMAGDPQGGALRPMAMMRAAGKPFICTEYAHAAPNPFASESLPLLGAYAALQDWDAVFAFAYSHRGHDWDKQFFPNFFDLDQHPTKLATLPATINLFCRGDVATPAEKTVVALTLERSLEEVRLGGPNLSAETLGVPRDAFFVAPVAVALHGEPTSIVPIPRTFFKRSVTGELTWDPKPDGVGGVVILNTPKTKGIIGDGVSKSFDLGLLSLSPGPTRDGGSVILFTELSQHTGFFGKTTRRYLLSATAGAENTEMGWKNSQRTSVGKDWGKAPSLVEGVPAMLQFKDDGLKGVRAWALNERGERQKEASVEGTELRIGPEYQTLWYEVHLEY